MKKRTEEKVKDVSHDQGLKEKNEYYHVVYIKVEEDNMETYQGSYFW